MATVTSIINANYDEKHLSLVDTGELMKTLKKVNKKYNFYIEVGVAAQFQKVETFARKGKFIYFYTDTNYVYDIPANSLKFFIKNIKMVQKNG